MWKEGEKGLALFAFFLENWQFAICFWPAYNRCHLKSAGYTVLSPTRPIRYSIT